MHPRSFTPALLLVIAATSAGAQVSRGSDDVFARRDEWQRVPDILAALQATEGNRIADIAAGDGYLTKQLSKRVGTQGTIFAVEVSATKLAALRALKQQDQLTNVEVSEGGESDPRLPTNLDGAVVLNSYHEFTDYKGMLVNIRESLRPGGLLVMVDNIAGAGFFTTRQDQASHHAIDPKYVEAELREAGFEIVDRQDEFIVRPVAQWMIVARRPPP